MPNQAAAFVSSSTCTSNTPSASANSARPEERGVSGVDRSGAVQVVEGRVFKKSVRLAKFC